MMSKAYILTALAVVAISGTLPVPAAPSHVPATSQHHFYSLVQVKVADTSPVAYVWEVRLSSGPVEPDTPREVFSSLASPDLRQWVSRLPAHSEICYTVGLEQAFIQGDADKVMGAAKAKTDDFSHFCHSKGVTFILCSVAA